MLRDRVSKLEETVTELRKTIVMMALREVSNWSPFTTEAELMSRFQRIYDYLGVEEKDTPEKTELVKKVKSSKQ